VVQKALEAARTAKLIGKSLEAFVTVSAEGETLAALRAAEAELPALFIVSKVTLLAAPLAAEVERATGPRCERCWIHAPDLGADPAHPDLCSKCADAIE
jgi:isoleucyl-tRNA synthetase